ncbi:hypothetical protein [Streptomyces sp. NPDC002176]|uniref:hypothetical protein n=1 Tax=Streptomyces sp. NPDC002176 TaxID=3364634 RepID=UPI00384F820A
MRNRQAKSSTIGSLGLLVPLAVFLLGGARAATTLSGWTDLFARHNTAVMAGLFLVFGLKLLGDGIGIVTS